MTAQSGFTPTPFNEWGIFMDKFTVIFVCLAGASLVLALAVYMYVHVRRSASAEDRRYARHLENLKTRGST